MHHHYEAEKRLIILTRFDSILLGDNPFFGVDHLSHERGRERIFNNQNFKTAVDVIEFSYKFGVRDMMITTHPNLNEFFNCFSQKTDLEKITFHPLIPYAQGYVQKLNEQGMIGTLKDVFYSTGFKNEIKLLTKGGLGLFKKDLLELFKLFLDIELVKLDKVKLKVVYLHPALSDLALSLNMKSIFETFNDYLRDKYKVEVGICTKNFPRLVDKLLEWNLPIQNIMTSFNKSGFQMNPSKKECEEYLQKYNGKVTAMNIFAGGYLDLEEAYEYILSQPKLRNIIVGVSSIEHAKETFSLFRV